MEESAIANFCLIEDVVIVFVEIGDPDGIPFLVVDHEVFNFTIHRY